MDTMTSQIQDWSMPELKKGTVVNATEAGGPGLTDAGIFS